MNVLVRELGSSASIFSCFALPFSEILSHRFSGLLGFFPKIFRGLREFILREFIAIHTPKVRGILPIGK